MPPEWIPTLALDRRRSVAARCSAAVVSWNSQKASMEIRGTGRSCDAAPKFPPALASASLVGSLDIVISSSLAAAAAGAANLRNCAGLLCCLGGHRGFALAVFL